MHPYLTILLVFVFIFHFTICDGENTYIRFKKYTVENGLSDSNINNLNKYQIVIVYYKILGDVKSLDL